MPTASRTSSTSTRRSCAASPTTRASSSRPSTRAQLRAVCGGGRYDRLLETLGGPSIPAVGFGFGDVVIGELLADDGCCRRRRAASTTSSVRSAKRSGRPRSVSRSGSARGRAVELVLGDTRPKRVLADADKSGASACWLIGHDEAERGCVRVRELATGCRARRASRLRRGSPLSPAARKRYSESPRRFDAEKRNSRAQRCRSVCSWTRLYPSAFDLGAVHPWHVGRIKDSAELYNVASWGAGFFTVNDTGHVEVTPRGPRGPGDRPLRAACRTCSSAACSCRC